MLYYILAGIMGIIVYQFICMLVYIFTNENDDIMAIMGMLVPFAIWNYLFRPVMYKIVLMYYRKNYNGYRFCYTTKDGRKDTHLSTFYAKTKDMKKFSQNTEDDYYLSLVRKGKDFKSIPYKTDVYKGQKWFKGFEMSKFKLK